MNLRPYQIEALDFLKGQTKDGWVNAFKTPTGTGRSMILASYVRDGKVIYVCNNSIMREQFNRMCVGMNVDVTFLRSHEARARSFENGEKVIICESVRVGRNELAEHIAKSGARVIL